MLVNTSLLMVISLLSVWSFMEHPSFPWENEAYTRRSGGRMDPICSLIVFYFASNYKGKSFKKVGGDTCIFAPETCTLEAYGTECQRRRRLSVHEEVVRGPCEASFPCWPSWAPLCAAVLYWDKIMAVVAKLRGMSPGLSTAAVDDSEAEDYADWEM